MKRRQRDTTIAGILVMTLSSIAYAGEPVGTAFIYQGQLKEAGRPFTGNIDLLATLFDAEEGGNPVGSPFVAQDVAVINALFSVELDFGSDAFSGQALWVQLEVRSPPDPKDTEPFTPLSPRQPLTATPYALHSLAPWQQSGSNVSYNDGNVGIGTDSPQRPLHVTADIPVLNLQDADSTGAEQSGYVSFLDSNGSERGWVGFRSQSNPHVSLMNNQPDGNTFLGAGGTLRRLTVSATGEVGIGTSNADVKLHVTGGTDAAPSGGGYIQAGNTSGANVVIDENEIMARNNGAASTLVLNNNGGDVVFGGKIQPNGGIDLGYELVVRSEQDTQTTEAFCSAGKRVIGGGCEIDTGGDALTHSRPSRDGTAWQCTYDTGVFGDAEVTAYAICVNVSE